MTTNPLDAIRALLAHDDDDNTNIAIRNLLIDRDDDLSDLYTPRPAEIERARFLALIDSLDRDSLSTLALDLSLCPLHMIDYAICFDDDDPECAAIRTCFPAYDS
jgi:hypothetical protein